MFWPYRHYPPDPTPEDIKAGRRDTIIWIIIVMVIVAYGIAVLATN